MMEVWLVWLNSLNVKGQEAIKKLFFERYLFWGGNFQKASFETNMSIYYQKPWPNGHVVLSPCFAGPAVS